MATDQSNAASAAPVDDLAIFTCSHRRLVVWRGPEEGWFHVHGYDGAILGPCEASIFRHRVEFGANAHALANVVNHHDQKGSVQR